jgi:ADP-heptose:LPS heptosyltransferase
MVEALVLMARRVVKKRLRAIAPTLRRRRPSRLRSIAYSIAGGMGDGIMALPALALIKKRLPAALIDVYVPAEQHAALSLLFQPLRVLPATIGSGRLLRYDALFTNTITAFRVGDELKARISARFCAGFRYPDEPPAARLYDFSLPLAQLVHDIDQNLALLEQALGVAIEDADRRYPPPPPALKPAADGLKIVLVHPGAGRKYSHKKWPFERYIEIIKRLLDKEVPVTVVLGPAEVHLYPFFSKLGGIRICSARGPDQLIAALRESRLFIGNDSGPAHCAAYLGIPTITLFGPTSASRSAPRGDGCVVIENVFPCAPCHFSRAPCRDNQCLKSISVEQLWKAVEQALDRFPA